MTPLLFPELSASSSSYRALHESFKPVLRDLVKENLCRNKRSVNSRIAYYVCRGAAEKPCLETG